MVAKSKSAAEKITPSHRPSASILIHAIIVTILLIFHHPTPTAAKNNSPSANQKNQVTGNDLLSEIDQLHASLARVTELLATADIPDDEAIVAKAAGLVHRVRSLLVATDKYQMSPKERQVADRQEKNRRLKLTRERRLRGKELNSQVEVEMASSEQHGVERRLVHVEKDDLARDLAETTITFPECNERLLEHCLAIISAQMEELQLDAEFVIHRKRDPYIEGYNKVVLVTDMTASYVKGRNEDGVVTYPFPWNDAITQVPRMLGLNGSWDCHSQTPEDCCAMIKASVPNPDTNGNYIECHVFIPFGGVGNKKRDDRIFINLSPDGRVHESPHVD